MAGPCIISFKGKDYSYEEFAAMLHDGLLADLVDQNIITGIEAEQLSKGGRGEYKPRKFSMRAVEEFPEIAELISDEGMNYKSIPNSVTLEEANGIIDYLGEDESIKAIKDMNNGMTWRVRFTIGQVLAKKLREAGDTEKMIDVLEEVTEKATELGQGIQALSMFTLLTPEGSVRYAIRQANKKKKKLKDARQSKAEFVAKELKKVNKQTVKKVIENVSAKIDKTQEIKPSQEVDAPSYGERNKVVTKSRYEQLKKQIKGKFFSNLPPELFEIAAYHLEASGRQFTGFAKKMVRDFGNKVKPYLQTLYNNAKKDLANQYDDFQDQATVDAELSKIIGREFKKTVKAEGIDIREIIESHYTKYDATKRSLTDKFIQDLGLSESEAKDLARLVETEFDKLATEKKRQIVDKLFTTKEKLANRKKKRTTEEEIVRLSNLGVFTKDEILKKFGEKMGWPEVTEAQAKEIEKLAIKVQEAPEGLKRFKAVEDLLSYQANMSGNSLMDVPLAIYYANILSGPLTHITNIVANLTRAMLDYTVAVLQDPRNARLLATAWMNGISKGLLEGQATLKTGYSPIRGKAEVPNILERQEFWGGYINPANYLKYVRRAMVAADVVFFESAKEMRMYQQAIKFAKDNDIEPGQSAKLRAAHVLGINDDVLAEAQAQAEMEFEDEVNRINQSKASDLEKKVLIKSATLDMKRRTYELIEQQAESSILQESQSYAARATYNYAPEGILGVTAKGINSLTTYIPPLKLVVPFTNIIANIMNETINYTPWGFARAARGGNVFGHGRKDWNQMSEEQKKQATADLVYKALIGTSLMAAIYILSNIGDDDDEPLIEITAGGTGNYAKNQALKQEGWQEYSIKVGNRWFSYKETPLFLPFSIIGSLNDYSKYNKKSLEDDTMMAKFKMAFVQAKDAVFNATAIAGMNTFLKMVTESNNETLETKLQASLANMAKGFIVPNAYTQTAREIESIMAIPMKETKGTWFGPILADIPFARDQYYNKVNVFGQEVVPDTDKFISTGEDDKLIQLFIKNKYFPTAPSFRTEKIIDPKTKEQRLMTHEEFYKFAKAKGEILKEKMLGNYETLNNLDPKQFERLMGLINKSAKITAKIKAQK